MKSPSRRFAVSFGEQENNKGGGRSTGGGGGRKELGSARGAADIGKYTAEKCENY